MPLHTDYRPENFDEFEGNAGVVKSLGMKLKKKGHPHVYLITGPSGCGKTTLSRIIAKEVGALLEGEEPTKSRNYREMDSADFRGIDSIRDIRKNQNFAPIGGAKSRLWLLDECHQLTKDAQEALLKALEEAHGHVYFVLATTEPEKLKDTLKRRCTNYTLAPLPDDDLVDYLQWVCEEESKEVPEKSLRIIAEQAQGSVGKALGILERVIDLEPREMEEQLLISEELEAVAKELCQALVKKVKWSGIAKILTGLKNQDPEKVRRAVLGYCSSILLKKDDPKSYLIMDAFRKPFYDTPRAQLILAAYDSLYSE